MDALAYDDAGIWGSALTVAQWDTIHTYQKQFNVRMVRINEYPGPDFGEYSPNLQCPAADAKSQA